MRKRILAIAISLVMAVSMAACTDKDDKQKKDSVSSNSKISTTTASVSTISKSTAKQEFDFSKYGVEYIEATGMTVSPQKALSRQNSLIVGISNLSGVYNSLYSYNPYDKYVCYTMFDYNVEVSFDGKPTPGVTEYKISDNGLVYTFTIKDNVKFWDGNNATSKDLEFGFYLAAEKEYDGPIDISKANIKGLDLYKKGKAKTIEGIKVIDDKTLEVTVDKVSGTTLLNLQIPLIEKKHYCANFKRGDTAKVKAKNLTPMGTGQYKFVSYTADKELRLEANQDYFKGSPKIKNLLFSISPAGKELKRVLAGETDIDMADVSPENMKAAEDAGFIDIIRFPTNGYGHIGLNIANSKFKDVKVRQALMYALNRASIVNKVYGEYASVVNIPESTISWAYDAQGLNNYEYNLEKAAKLLDEAGWKLNAAKKRVKGNKVFTIKFNCMKPHPVTDILVPIMKQDFAKLGIDITVEYLEWTKLYENVTKKQFDAYFMATGLTLTPDPASAASAFKTNGAQNYYSYSNSNIDKLYEEGASKLTVEDRKPIYKQINKILNNDLPLLFIYQRSDMWVANSRIKGYELSSFREFFYNLYKVKIIEKN